MSLEVKIKKKLKEFTLESELNVETGCTGLMGPSGSGKSITLKCIAGVETADSGRIVLDGKILYDSEKKIDLPPQKRKISILVSSAFPLRGRCPEGADRAQAA